MEDGHGGLDLPQSDALPVGDDGPLVGVVGVGQLPHVGQDGLAAAAVAKRRPVSDETGIFSGYFQSVMFGSSIHFDFQTFNLHIPFKRLVLGCVNSCPQSADGQKGRGITQPRTILCV